VVSVPGAEGPGEASEAGRIDRFRAALAANSSRPHGPLPLEEAGDMALALALERSAGRPVAVATADPLLAHLRLAARLEAAGAKVLLPDDPSWPEMLASAGAGVTGAAFGLAATGTVGITCGPGAPRGVSLVPPAHICLVRSSDVVENLEEALGLLSALPSAIAWVSGPSRSADLEMTLTVGVHGPAFVDVIIVADG
jgi:L-lactate dehydrogenase complex protein LldG